ncbi:alpha-L-fucosidase [Morganella morganii]|uniref:alpha-L-fucosidase n=1 Tax=Morganella morganii TaxID=582 RepID=UPI00128DE7B7|nr:alpha-L-fucosidase [Morganella morganii]MQC09051.1 alpha-L-fucosidase [Morganella morganii]MQC11709.1 alpha-L-fucosidase [Morganella morganii]MQC16388.1 alpha-L-fucosidase [Morganella morganii]
MKNKIYQPDWSSLDSRDMPEWYNEAKFGIFIHWGIFSVPAWRKVDNSLFGSYAEWYYASVYGQYRNNDDDFHEKMYGKDFLYRDFAPRFTAELFQADSWAELFKASGAKYVVLTTKHHDGFCLWPTQNKHKKCWNSGDIGPHRDLLGEITQSVRKNGLKMGIYYSIIDWETNWSHRPEGGYFVPQRDREKFGISEQDYPDEILIPQLKELVQNYQPCLIFSDGGEWDLSEEYSQTKEFLAWLYNEAPNKDEVVVNDRFFKDMPGKHGDYYSTEYNDKEGFGEHHPWEESRGIGKSYGFNRAEQLEDYCTSLELIEQLIDVVSKGGNFLLNVGPTADGRIPTLQQERLRDIGRWMAVNGEAIYGSDVCTRLYTSNEDCALTSVGSRDYLIVKRWPTEALRLCLNDGLAPTACMLLCKDQQIPVSFDIEEGYLIIHPLPWQFYHNLEYAYTFRLSR